MFRRLVSGMLLALLLTGLLTLTFNIRAVKGTWTGTIYIRADGSIDPPDAPIKTYDNMTYTLIGNITSSADGIVVERNNIVIDGAYYSIQRLLPTGGKGIDLTERINVTVKNVNIKCFGKGIWCNYSSRCTVFANNLTCNEVGILLYLSSNNIICKNSITDYPCDGVWLLYASNNSIYGNNITDSIGNGIRLNWSSNNSIYKNDVKDHKYGVFLSYSLHNNIYENNVITNNHGIWIWNSSNNKFYHNNLIDNIQQVSSDGGANIWNDTYPSGGNYWSDYGGADLYSGLYQNETGSDGIGDIPYRIDENNTDHYPLMNPWPLAPVYVKGIDVSHWQGSIIWSEVYGAGYRFAFVKASEGVGWADPNFGANMKDGRNAGLLMGAYHFARPDLGNNPKDEAEYFISVASEYLREGFLRPALDLEVGSALGKDALSNWVRVWMETVKNETGIEPIIYVNSNYANNYLDVSLAKYDLWIAHWTYDPSVFPNTGIWETWSFWQYSDKGSVPGITGNVDLDLFNGNMQRLCSEFTISNLKVLNVTWEDKTYPIKILSNSTVTHLVFNQPQAQISFNVTGPHGSKGYCSITIPKDLLKGPWTYTFEGDVFNVETKETENETHSFISFTYTHASTFQVTIQGTWAVPEFSPTLILATFMLTTLIITTVYKIKRKR